MSASSLHDDVDPASALINFLRSSAIMHAQHSPYDDPKEPPPQPHEALASIIDDERWTRRMLEDWFKGGTMRQRGGSITPEPEFRALYLVLLARLLEREKEQRGKQSEHQKQEKTEGDSEDRNEAKMEIDGKLVEKEKKAAGRKQHGKAHEEEVEQWNEIAL